MKFRKPQGSRKVIKKGNDCSCGSQLQECCLETSIEFGRAHDLYEKGLLFANEQNHLKAIELWTEANGLYAYHSPIHANTAIAYAKLGRYQEALESNKTALENWHRNPHIIDLDELLLFRVAILRDLGQGTQESNISAVCKERDLCLERVKTF